jgi:ribonucleoside-triphosphate reductase
MDNGLFPYSKRYLGTFRNHFSTIGINGVNEMIRNFTNDKHSIADEYGMNFACELLDHIFDKCYSFKKLQETCII